MTGQLRYTCREGVVGHLAKEMIDSLRRNVESSSVSKELKIRGDDVGRRWKKDQRSLKRKVVDGDDAEV